MRGNKVIWAASDIGGWVTLIVLLAAAAFPAVDGPVRVERSNGDESDETVTEVDPVGDGSVGFDHLDVSSSCDWRVTYVVGDEGCQRLGGGGIGTNPGDGATRDRSIGALARALVASACRPGG